MFLFNIPPALLGLDHLPAFPLVPGEWPDTILKLSNRQTETKAAKYGLTGIYTIEQNTASAFNFMFGPGADDSGGLASIVGDLPQLTKGTPAQIIASFLKKLQTPPPPVTGDPLTALSLDDPKQFGMAWTTYNSIAQNAQPLLPLWASTLTDATVATEQFWPTIAKYGLGYNLLLPAKVNSARLPALQAMFKSVWTAAMTTAANAGLLYVIDLSLFEMLDASAGPNNTTRFTPATVTLLIQDAATKNLAPVAVKVSGFNGSNVQLYSRANATDAAWLYALQAAKTSVTVYGIWLGHVYHWHLVAAAMQMTLFQNLPSTHPLYTLLAPQSKYLMAFDDVLMLLWNNIAPPTSLGPWNFLELCNQFAKGRNYFDDDPKTALAALGISMSDFTQKQPWDQYPIVATFLSVWDATTTYVTDFVNQTYANDAAVKNDTALQAWMTASGSFLQGNIHGLPNMDSRAALIAVLNSHLYRITMHGNARQTPVANPSLVFVANFPPCLQSATIPSPTDGFDTKTLLAYLPNTGTIGFQIGFYYIFGFSVPYESFIPVSGIDSELFFPGGSSAPLNQALIAYRQSLLQVMGTIYGNLPIQQTQWPRNIET